MQPKANAYISVSYVRKAVSNNVENDTETLMTNRWVLISVEYGECAISVQRFGGECTSELQLLSFPREQIADISYVTRGTEECENRMQWSEVSEISCSDDTATHQRAGKQSRLNIDPVNRGLKSIVE